MVSISSNVANRAPAYHRYLGKRLDESHLYPETRRVEIDTVVNLLWDSGVSDEDLASFSCALQILDSLTAACLRPQDWIGCLASKVHVKGTRLNFVMPLECKNKETLERSPTGLVVNHSKSKRTAGEKTCTIARFVSPSLASYCFASRKQLILICKLDNK